MGVKIIVHIRHIRGHTFDVEVDRDADCIGLKVVIWDLQKIAIDAQRLVYAGKEMSDGANLVELGIDDGSTVFLVERVENPNAIPVSVPIVEPQPIEMVPVAEESVSAPIPMEEMADHHYVPVSNGAREERIKSTIDLAFWVRVYCVFGTVVSVGGLSHCWGCLLPLICFIFGYFGCRKLNRCLLMFPLLLAIVIGPIGFVGALWGVATHFRIFMLAKLVAGFLHILIMASILKLMIRIKHLTCEEKCDAVERIRASIKCRCC